MKKLIVGLILMLLAIGAFAQTPGFQLRVATKTTAFGINVPIGTTVYCVSDSTFYACMVATAGTATLHNSPNFTQINKPAGTGTVTSVATGYGLTGGTITTSGTLKVDTTAAATKAYAAAVGDSKYEYRFADTTQIFEEASGTATLHTLASTPVAGSIYVTLNGMTLLASQYAISGTGGNKVTVSIPVYQYDRVAIRFRYRL